MAEIEDQPDSVRKVGIMPRETSDAFGDTFKKFNGSLHKFLSHHLDSKEEVDDLSQDVYLRVVQHLRPDKKTSWTYLKTIAINLLNDRFRLRKARESYPIFSIDDMDQFEVASEAASPEQILQAKQLFLMFRQVVENLKPNSRRAFMLHRVRGLTYKEIAQEMGISRSMVKKHICHVILELRKKVGESV
ncbi:MAG: sigma-70 family RNA polymerase sigma factor [Deltaproteobacteria bacterium]|nr:sigma-70 family RNA polymerase sigma factor [Deltaproteobacteria bacterium]